MEESNSKIIWLAIGLALLGMIIGYFFSPFKTNASVVANNLTNSLGTLTATVTDTTATLPASSVVSFIDTNCKSGGTYTSVSVVLKRASGSAQVGTYAFTTSNTSSSNPGGGNLTATQVCNESGSTFTKTESGTTVTFTQH